MLCIKARFVAACALFGVAVISFAEPTLWPILYERRHCAAPDRGVEFHGFRYSRGIAQPAGQLPQLSDLSFLYAAGNEPSERRRAARRNGGALRIGQLRRARASQVRCPDGIGLYPKPLEQVRIAASGTLAPGTETAMTIFVEDSDGIPANGLQPLRVDLLRPDGSASAYSGYYCAKNGVLRFPVALGSINAPPGIWVVQAQDLTAGLASEAHMEVVQRN